MKELISALERLQRAERRYEAVRRLNVRQFANLVNKNLVCGIPFDELVDELAALDHEQPARIDIGTGDA